MGASEGNTITVLDAIKHHHKIKLAGIYAPEDGQAFGYRSKVAHSDCVIGIRTTVDGDK